jgi:hypothetical protein
MRIMKRPMHALSVMILKKAMKRCPSSPTLFISSVRVAIRNLKPVQ